MRDTINFLIQNSTTLSWFRYREYPCFILAPLNPKWGMRNKRINDLVTSLSANWQIYLSKYLSKDGEIITKSLADNEMWAIHGLLQHERDTAY